MYQKDVINIAIRYLNTLKEAGINIDRAFLYGSYARQQATESSDIDLLLVSKDFDTNDVFILSKPWLYTTQIDHRIEPIAVGLKKFLTDDVSPILEIVRQEGIEIQL